LLLTAGHAEANVGVAFVHGTGFQSDATDDYWTWDNINSVRQSVPNTNNYLVVNCDLTQYMWADGAAGCVAGQLYNFIVSNGIGSGELWVETHSDGGNVIRWIMSNPTWDWRYPTIIDRIHWVNAMAPSSLGTPLADAVINGNVFEQVLGWLLGYANDAVRMQQTSWMPYYNSSWLYGTAGRPALPKGFWTIIGTDVDSSPFSSDSYCGSYWENVALDNIQNIYLDNCSDGFINCSSASGAGYVWFYDTSVMAGGYPLSHGQSRRNCFGLDVVLRNDI
jgi:hypothetical protein